MARRSRQKVKLSLFPFLSILACVMGVLTLMICALALSQMDTGSIASMFEFDQLKDRISEIKAEIQRLKAALDARTRAAGIDQQELARLRQELERLLSDKQDLTRAKSRPVQARARKIDPEEFKKRLAELDQELQKQRELRERMMVQLEKRLKPEEAAVVIQPSGSGVGLDPVFVECDATGVVIYDGKEPLRVHRAQLAENEQYLALLKRIADQPKSTVIFLIRDDGLSSYGTARNLAQANFARNGKLPVIGHGKIDLSMFRK